MNPADLILHNGKVTTLDPGRPEASAAAVAGRPVLRRRGRRRGAEAPRADDAGHRPRRPPGHPRPERLAPAPDPRRAQLQHGAALGRRAQPGRRPAHAARAGPAHAAAAVGAGGRRLDRVPVRRAAHAHARRDQRRRRPTRRCSSCTCTTGPSSTGRRCGPAATPRTRPTRPAARSSGTSRATRPACSSPGPTPRSCTPRWRRGRSCRRSTRRTPPAISCAS